MNYLDYLRQNKLPLIWCTGCGNGIILKAMLRAIDRLGWRKDEIVMVSGIGCSSRTPGYVDFNTVHTTHGRALAFATGIKMAKPELKVIVVSGDGDATAIGGNHFIHTSRRNIDLTLIIFNNYIYGMTGGQYSPTTPVGSWGSTAPYGNLERSFDICGLAQAAGASYVARSTVYHAVQLDKLIEGAMRKKGFSVVEVMTPCPTYYGRHNNQKTVIDMIKWQIDNTVSAAKAARLAPEMLQGKIVTGVLVDRDKPEYIEEYQKLIERTRVSSEVGNQSQKKFDSLSANGNGNLAAVEFHTDQENQLVEPTLIL
ncbi:2-oxoacid:ferredoxin oxidoreductase subunit beta [candidate division KSB1 bacterium]|nr:2-oxoacid:ferredoxin oxidoreductase subunit beta [candidate division KSB1 bacterium]